MVRLATILGNIVGGSVCIKLSCNFVIFCSFQTDDDLRALFDIVLPLLPA